MPQQTISLALLCNMNKAARIKVVLMSTLNNTEFHSATTTINDLESGKTTLDVARGATCLFDGFQVRIKPSFVDYLRAGWEVSLTLAIDYTASNGEPSNPTSLHYLGPNNQYEKAIFNVGSVVEPYDNDKMFPVFGFGGIPRHMGINGVSHCFAVNGMVQQPNVNGIINIVNTYK